MPDRECELRSEDSSSVILLRTRQEIKPSGATSQAKLNRAWTRLICTSEIRVFRDPVHPARPCTLRHGDAEDAHPSCRPHRRSKTVPSVLWQIVFPYYPPAAGTRDTLCYPTGNSVSKPTFWNIDGKVLRVPLSGLWR